MLVSSAVQALNCALCILEAVILSNGHGIGLGKSLYCMSSDFTGYKTLTECGLVGTLNALHNN